MKRRKPFRILALLLSLTLLPAIPAGAVGSVCGSAVDGYSVTLTQGAELRETTYWTGSDLRTEHYVNFKPDSGLRTIAVSGETLCSVGSVGDYEELLAEQGISAEVVKLSRLDTLDGTIPASVEKTGKLIVAEEAAETGSLGVRILAGLEQRDIPAKSHLLHLGSGIVEHGSVPELRHKLGLDAEGILAAFEDLKDTE